MSLRKNAFIDESLQADQIYRKSPFVEGFKTGIKAALVAGPTAATYALFHHGKSPLLTGLLGAAGGGLAFGTLGAASQEVDNRLREAELRYHIKNMKQRDPFVMLPPREVLMNAINRESGRGESK
jgi:hypothetical protein